MRIERGFKPLLSDMSKLNINYQRAWAENNLLTTADNYQRIRLALNPATKLCCVVKANAYGHGATELAKEYSTLGADWFAVSNIDEALQLREVGIREPILILGYTPVASTSMLSQNRISQCVYSLDYANALSRAAEQANCEISIHVKLDTGMGRIGFRCRGDEHDELDQAANACGLPGLKPEGVFMHFAVADEGENGEEFTRLQYNRFLMGIECLEQNGIKFALRHCCNSAAIFDYPEFHLDMVRAGVVLYGLRPSSDVRHLPELHPVMTLKSVISNIKTVYSGDTISYGRTFCADHEMRVATIPIGYADGFWRSNSEARYSLLVHGQAASILGRVCMDQLMVDVSDIECGLGDDVTVFGSQPGHTADDIARVNGTINYEIVCAVGERVPRVYVNKNS